MSEYLCQDYEITCLGAQALHAKINGFDRTETAEIFGVSPNMIQAELKATYHALGVTGVDNPDSLATTMAFYSGLFVPSRDLIRPTHVYRWTMRAAAGESSIGIADYHPTQIASRQVPGVPVRLSEAYLTQAEKDVFEGVILGHSMSTIGEALNIHPQAATGRFRQVRRRLGARHMPQAIAIGLTSRVVAVQGARRPMQNVGALRRIEWPPAPARQSRPQNYQARRNEF